MLRIMKVPTGRCTFDPTVDGFGFAGVLLSKGKGGADHWL